MCYQPAHKASSEEANMRDSRWQAVKWQATRLNCEVSGALAASRRTSVFGRSQKCD
jgi:hypothetical protein